MLGTFANASAKLIDAGRVVNRVAVDRDEGIDEPVVHRTREGREFNGPVARERLGHRGGLDHRTQRAQRVVDGHAHRPRLGPDLIAWDNHRVPTVRDEVLGDLVDVVLKRCLRPMRWSGPRHLSP